MAWVKQVLRGAEFTMESIQMMLFIIEEAAQTALMAYSTALQNKKMDLAKEILDDTLIPIRDKYFEFVVLYAIPMMPNKDAWMNFYQGYNLFVFQAVRNYDNYKKLIALGVDPVKRSPYSRW